MTIVTVPLYRVLFGINEWLELKEKYKYRLFLKAEICFPSGGSDEKIS